MQFQARTSLIFLFSNIAIVMENKLLISRADSDVPNIYQKSYMLGPLLDPGYTGE